MPLVQTITKIGSSSWRFAYSGTGPFIAYNTETGQVLTDEVGLAETTLEYIEIENWPDLYEPPAVEVIDTATETVDADSQAERYSPFANLVWRGNVSASYYIIEQYDSTLAEWEVLRSVSETERGYYTYQTDALADVTEHDFRITPYDSLDNAGAPIYFQFFMVRNPPPPSISTSYSAATGLVTVSART